ncbi:MAG: hypothetical protein WA876_04585 [Candidatus Acidiferrales bacterium]
MNISREVVTDLLPVYFSGEASADTRSLVEEYFRGDPDFERVARRAATPLDALRLATRVTPDAEKEKRDLECVHRELRRNKVFFGVALFLTLVPLAFFFSNGHFQWLVREDPWEAVVSWSIATVLWLGYFGRLTRRTASLFMAIIFVVAPLLRFSSAGGLHVRGKNYFDLLWQAAFFWGVAILLLIQYFARLRRRTAVLLLAIYATIAPIPVVWYFVSAGGPHLESKVGAPAILWVAAAGVWWMYFRLRRKTKSGEDSEC